MKTFIRISLVFVVIALFVTSCTMEKRVYRPGFHVDWNKKDNNEKPDLAQQPANVALPVNDNSDQFVGIQESVTDPVIALSRVSDVSFAEGKTTVKENIINKLIPKQGTDLSNSDSRHFATIGSKTGFAAPYATTSGGDNQLIAFLLCAFLGGFGVHSFYLGNTKKGTIQLVMIITGWLTRFIVIGYFILAALGIWVIIDLIRILIGDLGPGW